MYYIVVRLKFVGELFEVGGPYSTCEEAEMEMDFIHTFWDDTLSEGQYLAIVRK